MQIGNFNSKALDELTPELEKEIDKYCDSIQPLLDGCINCPIKPILKKYAEPCYYPSYRKAKNA